MNFAYAGWRCCITFLVCSTLLIAPGSLCAQSPVADSGTLLVYFGTYTHGQGPAASKGIYRGRLDLATGKLTIDGVTPAVEPSFLAVDSSWHLYAANEGVVFVGKKPGAVTAFSIDAKSDELSRINQRTS